MAKDDDKSTERRPASRGDAVRSAVDQAFQATAGQAETARVGAQAIVEEFAQAAGRVREVLEDLRPPSADELDRLRDTVAALERRVAALEAQLAEPKPRAKRSGGRS
jgi:phage shock protein A